MNNLTKERKTKIGLLCNKAATVLFVLFFINVCVIPVMNMKFFMITTVIIVILFAVCCIIGHIFLKDYKPD